MKKGRYILLIVLVFAVLAAAVFISYFASAFGNPPVEVPSRAYLDIPLGGEIQEVAPRDFWSSVLLGIRPTSVYDLWMNLRKAKVDGRIQAILIRLDLMLCDWAKTSEIRQAVLDFRKSGKKAYAYIEEGPDFDKEYYLATACDRIILHPLGWLGVNGIGGYIPFFKSALEKLGVRAEFEHVEEYKTAYSQFTEDGFTPAHKEMLESLYGDIFDEYVRTVASARNMSEADVRRTIDHGFYQGETAKAAGLVDDILYEDELQKLLRTEVGKLASVRFGDYTRVKPSALGLDRGRRIALIYGVGPILTGESLPQMIGGATVARWIRTARTDPSIAGIVFRVDSPGGSSTGSDVIAREVFLARKEKPVVVSMSDVAGSGGYWISMSAHRIVAQPQTLTGSIGVLAGKFDLAGLYEKLGIKSEKLIYGKSADIFSSHRGFSPEEKRTLKDEILWTYDQFLTKVAEGRNMTREDVDKVGKGRVWTGRQAVELKLVDELGGLSEALDLAKKLAGIAREEEVRLVVWPKKRSFWDFMFSRREAGLGPLSSPTLERAVRELALMEKTRIWALMPLGLHPK